MDYFTSVVVVSILWLVSIRIVEDKPLLTHSDDNQSLRTVPTSDFVSQNRLDHVDLISVIKYLYVKFNFMKKYGYLDSKPSDSEAQYADVAVLEAIKNVQRYGALRETGIIDKNTLHVIYNS